MMSMLAVQSLGTILEQMGIGMTGSIVLFAFVILIGIALLMFISNIPSSFILIAVSILSVSMFTIWGGAELKIIATIVAVVLGATIGMFLLKFFSKSGS
jgi:membrane protein DedA with SNARE-associated domain